ncbi:hypothetical protein FGIG_12375 [Fasciola gigantica]|uniref:Uncharacterized protein n=1 Tax=Fasciola gigantica TaxID=46835 RepID=A0A504YTT2_FASGI|nr:hypothetical protein FGIG_12375 [Fasciola gigantica]
MWASEFNKSTVLGQSASAEDKQVLKTLESSTRFLNGQFEVPLPWKNGCLSLPNNQSMVRKSLQEIQSPIGRVFQCGRMPANVLGVWVKLPPGRKRSFSRVVPPILAPKPEERPTSTHSSSNETSAVPIQDVPQPRVRLIALPFSQKLTSQLLATKPIKTELR